jgi:hypothetical protein
MENSSIDEVEGSFAFERQPLGEPLGVCTVIINHVVLSHPLEPLLLAGVQSLLCGGVGRRSSSIEVAIGCNKGGITPVGLDEPTSGSPIICIPEAGIYPHCLVLRIMIIVIHFTQLFLPVLKHSNRSPVYRKSE